MLLCFTLSRHVKRVRSSGKWERVDSLESPFDPVDVGHMVREIEGAGRGAPVVMHPSLPSQTSVFRRVTGLVKLEIEGYGYRDSTLPKLPQTAVLCRDPVEPSLRYLCFGMYYALALAEEHLLPLVANHSATLEKVESACHHPELAGLLATAPR